jgi:hypothetical protein
MIVAVSLVLVLVMLASAVRAACTSAYTTCCPSKYVPEGSTYIQTSAPNTTYTSNSNNICS